MPLNRSPEPSSAGQGPAGQFFEKRHGKTVPQPNAAAQLVGAGPQLLAAALQLLKFSLQTQQQTLLAATAQIGHHLRTTAAQLVHLVAEAGHQVGRWLGGEMGSELGGEMGGERLVIAGLRRQPGERFRSTPAPGACRVHPREPRSIGPDAGGKSSGWLSPEWCRSIRQCAHG